MEPDKQRLKIALSTIHKDKMGYFSSGQLVDLMSHVHVNIAIGERLHKLYRLFHFLHQDIWNLETIVLRLVWQKDLWIRNQLDETLWMQFGAGDIDLFHVEFRSIFDYLAKIIGTISDSPGQVPLSFEKLKNWTAKSHSNAQRLGEDLTRVVLSCEWFDDLKTVRDSIIHRGGYTLVLPVKGRILFQVHEGVSRKVLIPEIMFNENVADFELYAGLYTGYLIAYLEEVSVLIYKHLNLKKVGSNAKSYHQGLQILSDWIKRVLNYDIKNTT